MFGYIMTIILTVFIVSIITEHMVIKRLQMSPGVEIKNGRCRLKDGYGQLQTNSQMNVSRPHHQGQSMMNINEIHDDWYRPFVN